MVSVMPCTAKKFEAGRGEMASAAGDPHVDYVLTTRELGRMLRRAPGSEGRGLGVPFAAGRLARRIGTGLSRGQEAAL